MTLDLRILVPDGVVYAGAVRGVQAADASGRFGLLPGHEAFLTLLVPCVLTFQDAAGRAHFAAADGGVLTVDRNRVSVVTREAVVAEELGQVADAAAAMLEVRRQAEQAARTEFAELQTYLMQEIRAAEKHP